MTAVTLIDAALAAMAANDNATAITNLLAAAERLTADGRNAHADRCRERARDLALIDAAAML